MSFQGIMKIIISYFISKNDSNQVGKLESLDDIISYFISKNDSNTVIKVAFINLDVNVNSHVFSKNKSLN